MLAQGFRPFEQIERNPSRAKFIVFEGLDASGLSTQARRLHEWFVRRHQYVHLTKEPSEGPAGFHIRLALRHRLMRPGPSSGTFEPLDEVTFALLFAADRSDHLYTEVVPQLQNGIHVICDRYYLSSFAYQSLAVDLEWLRTINAPFLRPDLILYLDVPVEVCAKRITGDRARPERYEKTEQLALVQQRFRVAIEMLRKEGQVIEVIDGNRPVSDVQADVARIVGRLIAGQGGRNGAANAGQLGLACDSDEG